MVVTTEKSVEYAQVTATPIVPNNTTEEHGTMRIAFFTHDQIATGDATSSVALFKLPPGRVRLLLGSAFMYVNWATATADLDLGWDAYTDLDGDAVAADPNGLANTIDVETAIPIAGVTVVTLAAIRATGGTKVFESKDGVVIRATSTTTASIIGDDLVGYIPYVLD